MDEMASIDNSLNPVDEDDDSEPGIGGITIYQPLITSKDYYWFGQTLTEEHWIFTEYRKSCNFEPFCPIEAFEEIWRSEEGEDKQARICFAAILLPYRSLN
jgi:hypothetical protein